MSSRREKRPSFLAMMAEKAGTMAEKAGTKMAETAERLSKKTSVDEPSAANRMRNLDKGFFGEEDEEDPDEGVSQVKREGAGLLDNEPDRAETDFYNGDKYVGDVASGKRHGHGVYYYDRCSTAVAALTTHHSPLTHSSTHHLPCSPDSGDKYTGNWNMGKQEGHGVYVYANGDRYVGEWLNGKHGGAGTYYFKSGKIFQGTYKEGSPCGQGVFLYTNGEKLDGEWNGSAYPDYGIYTYANGDR